MVDYFPILGIQFARNVILGSGYFVVNIDLINGIIFFLVNNCLDCLNNH